MITPEVFQYIVYGWIAIAIIVFPLLLFVTAPYGRHSKTNWGPMINNSLGWFLMEVPSLIIFAWLVIQGKAYTDTVILVASVMWVSHYFHRSILFPFRLKTKGKKMPILIMLFAIFFNGVNAGLNGYWFAYLSEGYDSSWLTDPRFIAGIFLFILGFLINQYHDKILLTLRKSRTNGYKIPYGGLFKYVSCPNFLGEIIEWTGFVLVAWNLPALSFLAWTLANLIPRAISHHKWYRSHFNDYPKERKAVFPWIV